MRRKVLVDCHLCIKCFEWSSHKRQASYLIVDLFLARLLTQQTSCQSLQSDAGDSLCCSPQAAAQTVRS